MIGLTDLSFDTLFSNIASSSQLTCLLDISALKDSKLA